MLDTRYIKLISPTILFSCWFANAKLGFYE